MSKKLLVTGCSGFVGRHVAAQAIELGYEVTGLDMKPCPVEGVKTVVGDIRDKEIVDKGIDSVDYVIHLAARTSAVEFINDPADCYSINVLGFNNIIDSARKNGVKKFVYASSAAVYVDGFSEDSILEVNANKNHYAKSKIINEMMADSYHEIFKLQTVGCRYFNIFGPGENQKGSYASVINQFLVARKNGEPLVVFGDGTQRRDFIWIDDAASITLKLLEKGTHKIYNVGTGSATPFGEIADMIDSKLKVYKPNPYAAIYQSFTQANTKRLLETIGSYKFVSVKEGIEKMLSG